MDGIEASKITLCEEEIRRARHAYYANVSYFDSKIGELIKTLKPSVAMVGHQVSSMLRNLSRAVAAAK